MSIEKDVFVPMRDGVSMALDVYKPDSEGPWPVVLVRTPYVKVAPDMSDTASSPVQTSARVALGADGRPSSLMLMRMAKALVGAVPPVKAFLDAGYVVVVSDSRGTGYSEGTYDYYNIDSGPYDGYDTVEWIAEQPWCDGNVGVWGISGSGVLALATAITNPPHLKAIVTAAHPVDFYHDQWYPGGVFRYEDRVRWPLLMQECISPLDPGDPQSPSYERKRDIYERRYQGYYERMRQGLNPINLDWAADGVTHDTYDDFWQAKSLTGGLGSVTAPVLTVGVLHDHFISGTIRFFEGVNVTKRLVVGPGSLDVDGEAGDVGMAQLQMKWFDRFLKGIQNGVEDEPATRVYLNGVRQTADFPDWPPAAVETPLYLIARGNDSDTRERELSWESSPQSGRGLLAYDPAAPNRTPADTADQRSFDEKSLVFTTAPLKHDLTVVGYSSLRLYASPDETVVDLCVRISDVQPDGSSRLANLGSLKSSHFASHTEPSNPEGGQVHSFDVHILPICSVFKKGHRIRVAISGSDFPFCAPNPEVSQTPVYFGGEYPSSLVLPVISWPETR